MQYPTKLLERKEGFCCYYCFELRCINFGSIIFDTIFIYLFQLFRKTSYASEITFSTACTYFSSHKLPFLFNFRSYLLNVNDFLYLKKFFLNVYNLFSNFHNIIRHTFLNFLKFFIDLIHFIVFIFLHIFEMFHKFKSSLLSLLFLDVLDLF